jgi:nucleoside phosphorylase
MGMSAAAVAAMKLIHNFRPRYLCMCGITAGVHGKVNMGDILVPSPSWDWGSGKIERKDGESRFAPDPYQISVDQDLRTKLREYVHKDEFFAGIRARWPAQKPDHPLRLHLGPVASGAAVLADPNVVDSVKDQQRKLLGIEMEVYGVMTAGENSAKPCPVTFALKSVCDFGDEHKTDEFQNYAAYTSTTFLYQFALSELVGQNALAR